MNPRILIVEDEETLRLSLAESLAKNGFETHMAESGEQAIRLWTQNDFDLILLDVKLPGEIDGIEVLEKIRQVDQSVLVIMMTAYGDIEAAVRAMKLGAYDYINKPFMLEEMKLVLQKAMETRNLRAEVDYLRRQQQARSDGKPLISQHEKMKQVFEIVERVASTPRTSVLIQGESGTGKEIITQLIHNISERRHKPFVKIDCSTISETLMDSELFGHKKGAFTDAKEDKKGLFEHANGGTVFLDEIGEMKLSLQPKLLQVLETQTLRRVGDLRDIKVNVRVVAATNRDLFDMVQKREFREDLYYRLKVMLIELPPIRERNEDIVPLAEHFIVGFNREFRKNISAISAKAQEMLVCYAWPGNVRELKNAIERAVILADKNIIEPQHLPLELNHHPPATDELPQLMDTADKSLDDMERAYIKCVLHKTNGNKSEAAEILQISRSTLWQKLKKYGFD
jgi:two-component system response regulator AtoC